MAKKLPRRTFLRGLGGTALALPFLEAMSDAAPVAQAADADTKRFVVAYSGTSSPRAEFIVPSSTGAGYTMPRALLPLQSVRDHVSVVTGLKIPWKGTRGSANVPAAGRSTEFHNSTVGPLLSGSRTSDGYRGVVPTAPSADQVVAGHLASAADRFRSLEYRVQAMPYRGGSSTGRISFERDGERIVPREPMVSPSLAYEQLFTGFTPTDPAEAARRRQLLAQDGSILDLVSGRAERLRARLGRSDLQRVERHFDELRDLERRISDIPEPTLTCILPDHPGTDPAAESYAEIGATGRTIGYAQEEQRAQVMSELIYMAIACDLTRTVSWQHTFTQSFMSVRDLIGVPLDMHELGHGGRNHEDMADGQAWHMKHWGHLIERLRDTDELGESLLDKTALVFLMEGGHGFDPETGSSASPHSSENMVALVAGHGSTIRNGHHVSAPDRHPAEVTLSAMRGLGIEEDLGDLSSPINELIV